MTDNPFIVRLVNNDSGRTIIAWVLPDWRLTSVPLIPRKAYRKLLDGRYVPYAKGKITISGKYPFFIASDGVPVFMDYDRSFVSYPVDFPTRLQEFQKIMRAAARDVRNRRKLAVRYRVKVIVRSADYEWSIVDRGNVVRRGWSATRVQAERDAKAVLTRMQKFPK